MGGTSVLSLAMPLSFGIPQLRQHFSSRRWRLLTVATPEQLATDLTQKSWQTCAAFTVEGHARYVFLHDDIQSRPQAYSVVKYLGRGRDASLLIEDIDFGECTYDEALRLILRILAGGDPRVPIATLNPLRLDTPADHRDCRFCP